MLGDYENIWRGLKRDLLSNVWLDSYTYHINSNEGTRRILDCISSHLDKLGYQVSCSKLKKVYELKIIFPGFRVANMHEDPNLDLISVDSRFHIRKIMIEKYKKDLRKSIKSYVKKHKMFDKIVFKTINFSKEVIDDLMVHLNRNGSKRIYRHLETVKIYDINSSVRKYDLIQMELIDQDKLLSLRGPKVKISYVRTFPANFPNQKK